MLTQPARPAAIGSGPPTVDRPRTESAAGAQAQLPPEAQGLDRHAATQPPRDEAADRPPAAASPWARSTSRLMRAMAVAVVLALAVLAWGQYRQFSLLDSHVRYEGDNLIWSLYQLESEYLQMRDGVREALRNDGAPDAPALRLRWELFASRVPLVDPVRTRRIVDLGPQHPDTVAALKRLLARHDPVMAESSTVEMSRSHLQAVLADLEPMAVPIHDMTLQGNQAVAAMIGDRNDSVRQHNQLAIAITAFEVLAILAFAGIATRQVTALRRQGQELSELALSLSQARQAAEQASQAKSVFLANMSHELRTPFNGMLGMLSLLDARRLDAQQADCLRTARESATHLLQLLDDILDFSKLESGHVEIVAEPMALAPLVHGVAAISAPPARQKGLSFDTHVDPRLPAWVIGDAKRLRQILFNLASNAVKFTDQGGVRLRAELVSGPDADGRVAVRFEMRDTGIGMDEGVRSRLFQRFSQGDAGSARRYGGTGLGLEISRGLAQRMGGDIDVHSLPRQGSVFSVRLSFRVADAPTQPVAHAEAESPWPQAPVQPMDVLVVDDHPVNRKYMGLMLARLGHNPRLAEDGAGAIAAVQAQPPDLVLMDLHMPGQDGFDTTRALRALPELGQRLPIVALTADAYPDTRTRVAAVGMNGFLAKPVLPADMVALLEDAAAGRLDPGASRPPEPAAPAAPPVPASLPMADGTEPSATEAAATPAGEEPPRRQRFRSSDVALHLDMGTIGDVCIGVGLPGLRSLLRSFLDDDSGNRAELLQDLEAGRTERLPTLAHALKGSAASVGLRALAASFRNLETEGTGFDRETCTAAAGQLREQVRQSRALLERMGLL